MLKSKRVIDRATLTIMLFTATLFVIAAFEKGLTHDLLLETAVFLISVKLVLGSKKHDLSSHVIETKLDMIETKLDSALEIKRKSA